MTIRRLVLLGLSGLLVVYLANAITIFISSGRVAINFEEMRDAVQTLNATAYEMEINVLGTGLGVMKYVANPDPSFLERIRKDRADFQRFHAIYLDAADDENARVLGRAVGELYDRFQALGTSLTTARDQHDELVRRVDEALAEVSGLAIEQLSTSAGDSTDAAHGDPVALLETVSQVRSAVLSLSLTYDARTSENIAASLTTLRAALADAFQASSAGESTATGERTGRLDEALGGALDLAALDARIATDLDEFVELRRSIDDRLDEALQPMVAARIDLISDDVRVHIANQRFVALVLGLAIVVFTGLAMLLLRRKLIRPLEALASALERLMAGRYDTRLAYASGPDIRALFGRFNDMAAQLDATHTSLRSLNAELEARVAARTGDLERSNAELEQFAYSASHDLQEPLRMVSSYCDLLRRRYVGKLDANADEFIGFAVDGARRMQAMIQNLLAYSRLSSHRPAPQPIDLAVSLDAATKNLEALMTETGATVTRDALPEITGSAAQIVTLLQNLIANAIHYRSAEPPRIHVSAHRKDGGWEISVRDNGIGIPPEAHERIFQIFQRAAPPDTAHRGTGLGLALCRRITEIHGGRIGVESMAGRGSTFTFSIPDGGAATS